MPLQEFVNIELGGKTRRLRYDFNAFVALEDELKIPISELGALLLGAVKMKDLRTIVWAGLIHDDPTLTPVGAGALIASLEDMKIVGEAVRQAMEAAFPPIKRDSKN